MIGPAAPCAIRAAPSGNFDAQLGLGQPLRMSGLYGEAVPAYRAAVGLEPDDFAANEGLGLALDGAGRNEEGREYHRRAEALRRAREWLHGGA